MKLKRRINSPIIDLLLDYKIIKINLCLVGMMTIPYYDWSNEHDLNRNNPEETSILSFISLG